MLPMHSEEGGCIKISKERAEIVYRKDHDAEIMVLQRVKISIRDQVPHHDWFVRLVIPLCGNLFS